MAGKPGVKIGNVGDVELRSDGKWTYCLDEKGRVLEQFKGAPAARQWAREREHQQHQEVSTQCQD
jgi:hypothetical protein